MTDHEPRRLYDLATDLINLVSTCDSGIEVYVPVAIDVAATIDPETKRPLEPAHYHDAVVYQRVTGVVVHRTPEGKEFVMLEAKNNTHPQADPETEAIEWETPCLDELRLRRKHHEVEKQVEEMKRGEDQKPDTRFIGFCHECDMPMFAEIRDELGRFECPCGKTIYVEIEPTVWVWEEES